MGLPLESSGSTGLPLASTVTMGGLPKGPSGLGIGLTGLVGFGLVGLGLDGLVGLGRGEKGMRDEVGRVGRLLGGLGVGEVGLGVELSRSSIH